MVGSVGIVTSEVAVVVVVLVLDDDELLLVDVLLVLVVLDDVDDEVDVIEVDVELVVLGGTVVDVEPTSAGAHSSFGPRTTTSAPTNWSTRCTVALGVNPPWIL